MTAFKDQNAHPLQEESFQQFLDEDTEFVASVLVSTELLSQDFSRRNLSHSNFSGSDLRGSRFNQSCLFYTNFLNSNLLDTNLGLSIKNQSASSLCFSQDSKFLFIGGGKGRIEILDIKSNRIDYGLEHQYGFMNHIQVFDDKKILIASNPSKGIKVFDLKTGMILQSLRKTVFGIDYIRNHDSVFFDVLQYNDQDGIGKEGEEIGITIPRQNIKTGKFRFSNNCEYIALPLNDYSSSVSILHIQSATKVKYLTIKSKMDSLIIETVAFSPSGRFLCAGGNGIIVWDFHTNEFLKRIFGTIVLRQSLHFTSDERFLVFVGQRNKICVYETENWERVKYHHMIYFAISSFALSADSRYFAIGNSKITAICELDFNHLDSEIKSHRKNRRHILMSNDFDIAASKSKSEVLKIWDIKTAKLISSVKVEGRITCCDVSHDRSFVAIGCRNSFSIWNIKDKIQIQRFPFFYQTTESIHFSPNGSFVVAVMDEIRIYDLFCDKLYQLQAKGRRTGCVAITPDSLYVIAGSYRNSIGIWDLASGNYIASFLESNIEITCLSFSYSGLYLASFHEKCALRIWRRDDTRFKQIHCIKGTQDSAIKAVFSKDERLVACITFLNYVKVWEMSSGDLVYIQTKHLFPVEAISFSPEENILLTCGSNLAISKWLIPKSKQSNRSSVIFFKVWRDHRNSKIHFSRANHLLV